MKHYTEKKNHWTEAKKLEFLLNYVKNQSSPIDEELAGVIAKSLGHNEWIELIKQTFSEDEIKRFTDEYRWDNLQRIFERRQLISSIWEQDDLMPRLKEMLSAVLKENIAKYPAKNYEKELYAKKFRELKKIMRLSEAELNILLVLAFIEDGTFHVHLKEIEKIELIAKMLDMDIDDVREALNDDGKLKKYHCVEYDCDFNRSLSDFLIGTSNEPLINGFFTKFTGKTLPWEYFGDIAKEHGDFIEKMISRCDGKEKAPHIIMYGLPGTGKTSFAQSLVKRLKRDCYLVVCHDNNYNGHIVCDASFRYGALTVCADQVDPSNSVIIIDEADNMLETEESLRDSSSNPNKGMLNDLLDNFKVPTIWITNVNSKKIDESSCRRFDYSIFFDRLDCGQRKMVWQNNVKGLKLGSLITDEMQNRFASLYPVSAGGITMAVQNIARLKPKSKEVNEIVNKLMKQHCELLRISMQSEKFSPAKDYSLDGLNIKGKIPLDKIVEAIRNYQNGDCGDSADRPRMNLLLSGAPGTGKTEFVKYLGAELETDVIIRMGSNLLSKYVGETEQNISEAFAEAGKKHSILFLDEIDGMLQTRTRALRSWEVTQVNELLQQMENFTGVMVCATNFVNNLDPAAIRRFTFKLEFDYLDEKGKRIFFERMFQSRLTPAEERKLAEIQNLAPGDFRTVRQSLFYLGGDITNADRLDALQRESDVKQNLQPADGRRRIGF